MQKLSLPNLPMPESQPNSYDRRLAVKLNEILAQHRDRINNLIKNPNLPTYANNAAALAGGLVAGDFYRSGGDPDTVCVVH